MTLIVEDVTGYTVGVPSITDVTVYHVGNIVIVSGNLDCSSLASGQSIAMLANMPKAVRRAYNCYPVEPGKTGTLELVMTRDSTTLLATSIPNVGFYYFTFMYITDAYI